MIFVINKLSAPASLLFAIRPDLAARLSTEAIAMSKLLVLKAVFAVMLFVGTASAGDWVTAPSYYTHDPMSGDRVTQYSPIGPFYTYSQPSFKSSGYRNTRSSIQVGTSADHYHTTQQWGQPVQPYGEWRHPYRPHSVPYGQWGPQLFGGGYPYGLLRGGFGPGIGAGVPPIGGGLPGRGALQQPVQPGPNPLQPGFSGRQQLLDGRYPPTQQLGPFDRRQLFDHLYPPQPAAGNGGP